MMVQQQAAHAQMAAAQAHAQAHAQAQVVAQAQAAHAHAQMQAVHQLQQAQQPVVPVPMPLPKPPEILTEDKLQEKGLFCLRTEVVRYFISPKRGYTILNQCTLNCKVPWFVTIFIALTC